MGVHQRGQRVDQEKCRQKCGDHCWCHGESQDFLMRTAMYLFRGVGSVGCLKRSRPEPPLPALQMPPHWDESLANCHANRAPSCVVKVRLLRPVDGHPPMVAALSGIVREQTARWNAQVHEHSPVDPCGLGTSRSFSSLRVPGKELLVFGGEGQSPQAHEELNRISQGTPPKK